MPRYGCPDADRRELYRRMVFNVAVRNSDDHDLNFGLVAAGARDFRLSPAFDVVPVLAPHRIHRHAMLIGETAEGITGNLLDDAGAFGISRDEASEMVREVASTVREGWRDVFYGAGFGDEELRKLEPVFGPIPDGGHHRDDPFPGSRRGERP